MNYPQIKALGQQAAAEIGGVLSTVTQASVESFCADILGATTIACFGGGREGLMMRAFTMRLMHLGLNAHYVGDMTTPPLGSGDLLIASAGAGGCSTVLAIMQVARQAGARVLIVTAPPAGPAAALADGAVVLQAQTMANETSGAPSLLPMGSLFEAAQLVLFDLVSIMLREKTGQAAGEMSARHTNLE